MNTPFESYLNRHKYANFDIQAVLFDMDGVLYDSMKWHAKSWKETMDAYNLNSTESEFYLYEGQVGRNTINDIVKRERGRDATDEEKEQMYSYKTDLFSKYNDGSLIPHAFNFVKKVSNEGYATVIVTGSGQPSLIQKLDDNFERLFQRDKMVTAFDVKHGKPHPEPYLMGLEKAGNLFPNQAIVVENAPLGVRAAVAAGIFTIAINTGPLPDLALSDAGADIVLPSMEALFNNWDNYIRIMNTLAD